MLFHWYLFVFLIILYLFAKAANQRYWVYKAGEYECRYKWFTSAMIVAVLTYVAATRHERFIDTLSYIQDFMRCDPSWDTILGILRGSGKDKSFYIIRTILKFLLGEHFRLYLGAIAGICLVCVFHVYRKHSSNLFITTFLFIASGEFVMWTHNGIRQFIAVSMVFAATDLLLQKKYVPYIAIILLASTFHASALVMLPVIYVVQGRAWNMKAIFMMLGIFLLTSSSSLLNDLLVRVMENSQYANDVDALFSTGGVNGFRVLVFAIPPLMALLFRHQITALNIPLINLAVNMSAVSLGFYIIAMFTSGIYIGRLPIYFSLFNYILLPWIIERFFSKDSARLIYLLLISCYMIYYYYQMHIVWGAVTAL
jgi:hypothetical protein